MTTRRAVSNRERLLGQLEERFGTKLHTTNQTDLYAIRSESGYRLMEIQLHNENGTDEYRVEDVRPAIRVDRVVGLEVA